MKYIVQSITQSLRLPSACVLCRHYHPAHKALCKACCTLLVTLQTACPVCALPGSATLCGHCLRTPPAFDKVYTAYSFEEPLRSLVHRFKYQEGLYLRFLMADLMTQALPPPSERPQCLVPVPMHSKRLRQRGFNQAAVLCRVLSKQTGIAVDLKTCKKIIHTPAQAHLKETERRQNLRHSFRVKANSYQHVAVVDDLMTTGSTAHAVAVALKQQGVSRVDVYCIARTPV